MKKKTAKKKVNKTVKKTVKKTTKKKVKKKVTKKKTTRKEPLTFTTHGLDNKKLKIMSEIPFAPCSSFSKDRHGIMFAHTHADKVFHLYYTKCIENRIVISMPELMMSDIIESGRVVGSRAVAKFLIKDADTGETESFMGAGQGDNGVWSDNSAQTVAFKQGLLMYFLNSWPQPESMIDIVKESFETTKGPDMVPQMRQILPKKVSEILEETGGYQALLDFFGKTPGERREIKWNYP